MPATPAAILYGGASTSTSVKGWRALPSFSTYTAAGGAAETSGEPCSSPQRWPRGGICSRRDALPLSPRREPAGDGAGCRESCRSAESERGETRRPGLRACADGPFGWGTPCVRGCHNQAFTERAGPPLRNLSGAVAIDTAMLNLPLRMEPAGRSQFQVFGTDPTAWTPVSPRHRIENERGVPPLLLLGSDGRPVTRQQVMPMKKKLQAADMELSSHEAAGRAYRRSTPTWVSTETRAPES